jgi:hypothetical protein
LAAAAARCAAASSLARVLARNSAFTRATAASDSLHSSFYSRPLRLNIS